jgi:hypothetical protein
MTKKNYNTIEVVQEHDEATALQESSDLPIRRKRNVVVYAAIGVVFLLALTISFKAGEASSATTSTSEIRSPLKSSEETELHNDIRSCRADEATCPKNQYLCTDDGKCHASPPTRTCDDYCKCEDEFIELLSCDGVQCNNIVCGDPARYDWCHDRGINYLCTVGVSLGTCASHPSHWSGWCTQCCDIRYCHM